jgi:hypothetical protein
VLRHTFAVTFLDRTKDIHALRLLLAHSDLKTTQVDARYTNADVQRSFARFNKGASKPSDTQKDAAFDSHFDSRPTLGFFEPSA